MEDINIYTDIELEELAALHMERMRLLMMSYSSIHNEGVKRNIKSFSKSDVKLLSEEEQVPVADYLAGLNSKELVNAVYRYKEMPTCFKLTLAEISKRLGEKDVPTGL